MTAHGAAHCLIPVGGGTGFAHAGPVPPLLLLGAEERVAGLSDGAAEDVFATGVVALTGDRAKTLVEFLGFAPGELVHGTNSEDLEIGERGGSDTCQVIQPARIRHTEVLSPCELNWYASNPGAGRATT